MSTSVIYGACDQCSKFFDKDTNIVFLKETKDKILNLEYCNDNCLNACKEKYNFLIDYDYEYKQKDITDIIDADKLNNTNEIVSNLIGKYPDYCIKNYEDFKNGENPILLNGVELLELLVDVSSFSNVDKRTESFVKECKEKNLF